LPSLRTAFSGCIVMLAFSVQEHQVCQFVELIFSILCYSSICSASTVVNITSPEHQQSWPRTSFNTERFLYPFCCADS
jgi:hypothetical protein